MDFLPLEVVEWLGVGFRDPEFVVDGEAHDASALNDDFNFTFQDIAEAIRRKS